MQKKRNCGLPEHGGADPDFAAPVAFYGKVPLDPANPKGTYQTLHTLKECPKSYVTAESMDVLDMYALHKQFKALPHSGGLLDQPAILMDALSCVDAEMHQVRLLNKAEATPPQQTPSQKKR